MRNFVEGNIDLSFDDTWHQIVKWDDETAYRDGIQRLSGTAAVDFIGLQGERPAKLVLLELKDFRAHAIENKKRLTSGDIYQETARKVRDSIAGLVGAARRRQSEPERWLSLANGIVDARCELHVVLWLDEDRDQSAAETLSRTDQLRKALRWLTARAIVVSRRSSRLDQLGIVVNAR